MPNLRAILKRSADLLNEYLAPCHLPVSVFLLGKKGFMCGSLRVEGFSAYCVNGFGGCLMKKLCSFWGSLANASLAVNDMVVSSS